MALAGIDVTIEETATGIVPGPEIYASQGFPEDFPSPTPASEVTEHSGIDSLFLVIVYHCTLRDFKSYADNQCG